VDKGGVLGTGLAKLGTQVAKQIEHARIIATNIIGSVVAQKFVESHQSFGIAVSATQTTAIRFPVWVRKTVADIPVLGPLWWRTFESD
jgi:hypothetical protein